MLINVIPYVHECAPLLLLNQTATELRAGFRRTLEGSDGVLLFSSETFEPGAVAAVRQWYAETARPAYICGPLLPTGSQASTNEKKLSAEAEEIQTLLDTTLKTAGEHSLLYVSESLSFARTTRLTARFRSRSGRSSGRRRPRSCTPSSTS